ncbi:MAG: NADH:ubiquinone reductase (Na(+)-transporting) subunit B [Bacteroidales bacterium]|jgi:Na+-transporting NADH:ubiquinone oxidoreductase subunit B|nr:NADH:ubiquinone reductase (Na(+)-transporting) subunit B [Bacteroidales bacterium]
MKKFWAATVDAFSTFLKVPGTVTRKGAHVRDAIDLKRIMIIAVISVVPAAIFGMWNVGYQHSLAIGDGRLQILANFWYGFLKVLPLYVVSYGVGLFIEFFSAGIRNEEVNEGYLMSGMLIPLIVPVTIPLWMLAIAVAFSVIFVKECFGGTGMNIWNPALVTRAVLFFSYPSAMSGSQCWISLKAGENVVDGFTGATPLALEGATAQYGTGVWDYIIGTVPGSVGETSVIAILLGAFILLWTGVASWRIMLSSVLGAIFVGSIANIFGVGIPFWQHLIVGGFAFGTVFMATDPVTSAQTERGKVIYGVLVGAICVVVRLFNPGYAEGMMLAILLGNTFAPLIDHYVVNGTMKRRTKAAMKTA